MNRIRIKIFILFTTVAILYGLKVLFFYDVPVNTPKFEVDKYVYDNCDLIDQGNIFKINELCKALKKESGVSFIIVTVETVGDIEPHEYTEQIMKDQRISSNNEKVLLFYSKQQGLITIKYDVCLQYILNEETCNKIIDEHFIANFKKADQYIEKKIQEKIPVDTRKNPVIGEAFYKTSKALYDILHAKFMQRSIIADKMTEKEELPVKKTRSSYTTKIIIGSIVVAFAIIIIFKIKELHCPKCHNALQVSLRVLQRVSAHRHGLNEKVYKCKNCGYVKRKKQIIFPRRYRSVFNRNKHKRS